VCACVCVILKIHSLHNPNHH